MPRRTRRTPSPRRRHLSVFRRTQTPKNSNSKVSTCRHRRHHFRLPSYISSQSRRVKIIMDGGVSGPPARRTRSPKLFSSSSLRRRRLSPSFSFSPRTLVSRRGRRRLYSPNSCHSSSPLSLYIISRREKTAHITRTHAQSTSRTHKDDDKNRKQEVRVAQRFSLLQSRSSLSFPSLSLSLSLLF